jgi:peptidoglycan/LPS O-acetylase OafA/YrhL
VLPLLLPLLLRYLNFRSAISIFITVIMGGIFLRSYLWHTFISEFYSSGPLQGLGVPYYREIYYPTYCRLDGLAVGVAIAAVKVLRPSIWERVNQNGNAFLTAGLAFLALALFVVFHEYSWHSATFGYPLLSLGFGGLVMAALARQGIFSKVKVPGAGFGATLAFAFYLTHKQMIHITKNFLVDANIAPQSFIFPLVIFVVCLISAVLLYITIERPFLLLRDRLLHSSRL